MRCVHRTFYWPLMVGGDVSVCICCMLAKNDTSCTCSDMQRVIVRRFANTLCNISLEKFVGFSPTNQSTHIEKS